MIMSYSRGYYEVLPSTRLRSSNTGSCLSLLSTHLKSHIVDLTVSHTLTQVYHNGSDEPQASCVYTFPLYESSAVTSFTAYIGSRKICGVVHEKAKAREKYEKAIAEGRRAALLDQNRPDVFTTRIGNVSAGEAVRIEIGYIHDLKQDTETGGVKLVVPTAISPRYGELPEGISAAEVLNQVNAGWAKTIGHEEKLAQGIEIEVEVTMSGDVTNLQSTSHPISFGPATSSNEGNSGIKRQRVTLANASTDLGKDFVLTIVASGLDAPRGFSAPDPKGSETSNMMVSLVPKFTLPQMKNPEIVLVVDRSGSMVDNMNTVKSALMLLLASMPQGTHFNICCFGSRYDFLFEKSVPYNAENLKKAQRHVGSMDASYGGTEIYQPIKKTIEKRLNDLSLQILFLTDGDVWNGDQVVSLLSNAVKYNVRLFPLGIGDAVTHSIIESYARAGNGYCQTVGTNERLERKVIRMLKAALMPIIGDWSIDWNSKSASEKEFTTTLAEIVKSSKDKADITVQAINEVVSLYDENVKDSPPKKTSLADTIPAIPRPPICQAPTLVPHLYPWSRFTVYFSLKGPAPKEVTLNGTFEDPETRSITPLALNIPIHSLDASAGAQLRTLFGRTYLQDLSETRYPAYFTSLVDPTTAPAKFQTLVEREGAKAGIEYGLTSKWTSFVAVDESKERNAISGPVKSDGKRVSAAAAVANESDEEIEDIGALIIDFELKDDEDDEDMGYALFDGDISNTCPPGTSAYSYVMPATVSTHSYAGSAARKSAPTSALFSGAGSAFRRMTLGGGASEKKAKASHGAAPGGGSSMGFSQPPPPPRARAMHSVPTRQLSASPPPESAVQHSRGGYARATGPQSGGAPVQYVRRASAGRLAATASVQLKPEDVLAILTREQQFSGEFALTNSLLKALDVAAPTGLARDDKTLWATVLVYIFLAVDKRMQSLAEEWEMVAEKAKNAASGMADANKVADVETEVKKVLGV